MKSSVLIFVISLLWVFSLKSQNNVLVAEPKEISNEDSVYIVVEKMPEFPGGVVALRKFIQDNFNFGLIGEMNIQGSIYVRFIVNNSGKVDNAQIVRGVAPLLDDEALRVVNSLPDFKPGTQNGKPVNVWYSVPIHFHLN